MQRGIERTGEPARLVPAPKYGGVDAEVAVFYGFNATMRRIFADYREAGKTVVYVDLGYFGRVEGGALRGYHKVVVNGRHPTAYFQNRAHDDSRARGLGLRIKDWRSGRHIIVAGMSAKAAEAEGFRVEAWERKAIARLRSLTDREIIYRPKPSWSKAQPIEGARFEPGREDLPALLADCHAVVTHHSNVAVDGLIEGVPAFAMSGVAVPLATGDLSRIETPHRPEGREQWLNDLCYCQWNVKEIAAGLAWRHLKDEGLVP